MDNAQHLREKSLEAIKGVQWIPSWGQNRIEAMVATRPDWCISRQRTWGVPICLFVNKETGELHPETDRLIEEIAKRVEKSGIQAWWDLEPEELLGADADKWQKVPDTLDVWFDSGSTSATVVGTRPEFNGNDADMYLEGSDQHRGWFMSSLMLSMAINGKAPYKKVLTHGFTVDAEGRKMSKSIGNTVAPQEVIKQLGADVLRLWVASTDYTGDMTVSKEIFQRAAESYRRIRNTSRFFLANLSGFDPEKDMVAKEDMVELDRWAVACAAKAQKEILKAYDDFDFHQVIHSLVKFCSIDMGSFYLDIIKDRQYTARRTGLPAAPARPRSTSSSRRWSAGWPRSSPSPQRKSGRTCPGSTAASSSPRSGRRTSLISMRAANSAWTSGSTSRTSVTRSTAISSSRERTARSAARLRPRSPSTLTMTDVRSSAALRTS